MRQSKKNDVRKFIITATLLIIFVPAMFLLYYQYNNRLFLIEAEILWDQTKLNEIEFRNGSTATRASMVVDIIGSKKYIGERCDSIPNILGNKTGDYYHSDSNSTYKLSEEQRAGWVLTFICGENGSIEKVIIRKSCCSSSRKFLYWAVDAIKPVIKIQHRLLLTSLPPKSF